MKKYDEIFKNPPSEYRGCPFWAWNSSLDKDVLEEQIEIMKEMGFGGFYMHVRQGLETKYMGKDFIDAVKCCIDKARSLGMLACLYDEDRWPSGAAGGFVTCDKRYRQRFIHMTREDISCDADRESAYENGEYLYLGAFDVEVGNDGKMVSYTKIDRDEDAKNKYYFFCGVQAGGEARYNLESYVDTMSKKAIDRFIEVTHKVYAREIGGDFGKAVPTIFTDEPQVFTSQPLKSGFDGEAKLPWSIDFDLTYKEAFGDDITNRLPELFFCGVGEKNYTTLYNYHRHITDRFAAAFPDNIGAWCKENGIDLTGHFIGEDDMKIMTLRLGGDVMRMYKHMGLPGIDILFDDILFTVPKQCQSVVRQYGKRGMLSELYGVTGWDFDFRGHKFQGDWQACLGVTHRVPHLAWQTMKGEGKRDYPASIFYQAPWYKEYKTLENHYARVAAAMSEGEAVTEIAVIHPIESFWMRHTSTKESDAACKKLDERFSTLCTSLLENGLDFDYLSEALLPDLVKDAGAPLRVGKMSYKAIVVCDCLTLRKSTVEILEKFKKAGGKLIFMGETPKMCDGVGDVLAEGITEGASVIDFSAQKLFCLLEENRKVKIDSRASLMCTQREDENGRWLFCVHTKKPECQSDTTKQSAIFTLDGLFVPTLYDTMSGEKLDIPYEAHDGKTKIFAEIYGLDSLLIRLEKTESESSLSKKEECKNASEIEAQSLGFKLEEQNVLLLDMARYSLNGGAWSELEEIMRIDERVRKELGLASRRIKTVQPWFISDYPEDNELKVCFNIASEIEISDALLAIERPDRCKIRFNGKEISNAPVGYYVDKEIKTLALPTLNAGENQIEISMPFGLRTDLEACYLIGDFGVEQKGAQTKIVRKPDSLCYGSVTSQGLPFYSGNVSYFESFKLDEKADIEFEISDYFGALVGVKLDGKDIGRIISSPFRLIAKEVEAGEHTVEYILFGNRHNTFSALHHTNPDKKRCYKGPVFWRSNGDEWSYEYVLKPMGILKKPIIRKTKVR